MIDLTAITTPYGLLDEVYGPGTQEALTSHGGPYEWFSRSGWVEDPNPNYTIADGTLCIRVKAAPPKSRTIWMLETPSGGRNVYVTRAAADHDARVYGGAIITEWTEVLP